MGYRLKQKEMQEQVMQTYLHEMAKPLARYKDDEDLDRMMRDLDREGDPMAAFLKKKKTKEESGNGKMKWALSLFFYKNEVSELLKDAFAFLLFILE